MSSSRSNRNTQPKERELLISPSQPLVSLDHRLVLFFSAKSGCTFAIKWFLQQTNMLDAATYYHPWVHNYRRDVLYESEGHARGIREFFRHELRIVKVVRNPYARAASSYVHANLTGYADKDVSRFLRRRLSKTSRFSFLEFVEYLHSIDVRSANVHHRTQTHRAERAGLIEPHFVIRLESSMEELPKAEKALGLPNLDLNTLRSSVHNTHRSDSDAFCGQEPLVFDSDSPIPPTSAFYDSGLKQAVAEIYGEDFRRFGYDVDTIPK